MVLTMWVLADLVLLAHAAADGPAAGRRCARRTGRSVTSPAARPLPGALLWRDLQVPDAGGRHGLGLFAQIGLIAHLFSLLVPALGAQQAGLAMGLVTALAIGGRTLVGWLMPRGADRRLVACASYGVQLAGSLVLLVAAGASVPLLLLGVVLFGAGFGNATSLPPLIAQVEFVDGDVQRVVALIVAIAQATYAFAPAVFGLIREFAPHATGMESGAAPSLFAAAALVQALAIGVFLAGRRR